MKNLIIEKQEKLLELIEEAGKAIKEIADSGKFKAMRVDRRELDRGFNAK